LPLPFSLGDAVDGEGDGVDEVAGGGARFGDELGGRSVEVGDFGGVDDGELELLGVNEVGSKDGVTIDEDEVWEGRSEVRYGTATGVLSTT